MRPRHFGLPDLPVLDAAGAFEILTEVADLVCQQLCGCRAHQELAHPTDDVGGGGVTVQPVLQQLPAELPQRGLHVARVPSLARKQHGPGQGEDCTRILLCWSGSVERPRRSQSAAARRSVHGRRQTLAPFACTWRLPPNSGVQA